MNGSGYKMSHLRAVPAVLLSSLLGGMLGCATSTDDPRSEPEALARVEGEVSTSAPLVASLTLTSGQVLDFYDFGTTALIVETGAAYMSPVLNSKDSIPPDQIVNIWTRLAPGIPVPAALETLQHRLTSLPMDPSAPHVVPSFHTDGKKIETFGNATLSAPVGCSNGCCDFSWLSTLVECQGGYLYSWFLYNYGWSYANGSNIALYNGLVCAAQGTSTYTVQIAGSGGTWSVPQATYRWFHWTSGSRRSMSSTVNSASATHLHTYCGGFN